MKNWLMFLSLLAFFTVNTVEADWSKGDQNNSALVSLLQKNTFKIRRASQPRIGGTAFIVRYSNGGVAALTNAHVCGNERGMILNIRGKNYLSVVDRKSTQYDLCKVKLPLLISVFFSGIPLADSVKIGSKATIFGFPYLSSPNPNHGYVVENKIIRLPVKPNAKNTCKDGTKAKKLKSIFGTIYLCYKKLEIYMSTLESFPGNSGSPVVNSKGKLIGVLAVGARSTNYGGFVGVEHVSKFLGESKKK